MRWSTSASSTGSGLRRRIARWVRIASSIGIESSMRTGKARACTLDQGAPAAAPRVDKSASDGRLCSRARPAVSPARALGLPPRTEEVVARVDRARPGALRRAGRLHPGLRVRALHLHDLLMPPPAPTAGPSARDLRRFGVTVGGGFLVLALLSAWRGHTVPPRVLGT